jgi:hypothetical protein
MRKVKTNSLLEIIKKENDKWRFTLKKCSKNPALADFFEILVLASALEVCLDYLKDIKKI